MNSTSTAHTSSVRRWEAGSGSVSANIPPNACCHSSWAGNSRTRSIPTAPRTHGHRSAGCVPEHRKYHALRGRTGGGAALRFRDALRRRDVDSVPGAIQAAWTAALPDGAISDDLRAWRLRCLIFAAAGDIDLRDLARHAA